MSEIIKVHNLDKLKKAKGKKVLIEYIENFGKEPILREAIYIGKDKKLNLEHTFIEGFIGETPSLKPDISFFASNQPITLDFMKDGILYFNCPNLNRKKRINKEHPNYNHYSELIQAGR